MARYRVIERCFLQPVRTLSARECRVGEEIEFDGVPGLSLLPLDAEARAAKLASIKPHWAIPSPGWHTQLLRLANSLGGGTFASLDEARDFVAGWIAEQQGA